VHYPNPPVVKAPWPRAAVVLVGGLILGTADLSFASLFWKIGYGVPATRVMQSVARGVLGTASFEGGVPTALLGALLHYTIAVSMAATYYLVSRKLDVLTRRPIPCGVAYGVLLYLIMNLVVLPLSAVGMPKFDNVVWVSTSIVMHMVFGLICAFTARRALRGQLTH
jgi:uncharacterized protein YacL